MNPNSSQSRPEKRLTRRQVIFGSLGVAVVAGVGIPAALAAKPAHPAAAKSAAPTASPPTFSSGGKLVSALLATHPFYAAHRGGSHDWPEMSLEGYRKSVAEHVNALEISLARTSDGVWFGLHDATLDRTSGTTGFVASEHTWAEVQQHKITAKLSVDHAQAPQPYLKLETLVEAFGLSHTIFVDPKATDNEHYPELLELMSRLVPHPTNTFVAKGYGTGHTWAAITRAAGYTTWGFYYGKDLAAKPELLAATTDSWNLLGLDYQASDAQWATMRAQGKPIIGHIIPSKTAAQRALGQGAQGLMVSGVREVLG